MGKPVITKEHGSWVVLLIPAITGISASNSINYYNIILFVISILLLFLSYTPAEVLITYKLKKQNRSQKIRDSVFWLKIYSGAACISGTTLILNSEQFGILVFAVIAVLFFGISTIISIKRKNVWSDLAAIAGLTLSAPAVVYISDGAVTSQSIVLYVMNLIFFGSSAFYVHLRMKINSLKVSNPPVKKLISIARLNLIYHLTSTGIVLWFSAMFPSYFLIAVYLPMAVHAVAGTFRVAKTNFKRLGFTFLGYSLLFAVLISFSV